MHATWLQTLKIGPPKIGPGKIGPGIRERQSNSTMSLLPMSSDDTYELTVEACKYLNYCRRVAVMSKEEYWSHYNNKMTDISRIQIQTLPNIHDMSISVEFPWSSNIHDTADSRIPSPTVTLSPHDHHVNENTLRDIKLERSSL